jgi:hypothetical protein
MAPKRRLTESRLRKIAQEIWRDYDLLFGTLPEKELLKRGRDLQGRAMNGTPLYALLPEAYALVREVASRTLRLRPYENQVMGAIALHERTVIEMPNGEGKTLTATMPAYLNSLSGQNIHIATYNDYLASRDAKWMGPIYLALGLSVAVLQSEDGTAYRLEQQGETLVSVPCSRRQAYACNIVTALARRLRINNWIIPGLEVGQPTAAYLTHRALRSHRATYIFYLIWVVVFAAAGSGAQFAHLSVPPLPFGPLGFTIILTFGSQLAFSLVSLLRRYAQRINYREYWTTTADSRIERQEIAIRTKLEDWVIELLENMPGLSPEEKATLLRLLTSGDFKNIPLILKILRAFLDRQAEAAENITVGQVVLKFLLCTFLALGFTLLGVYLIGIFFGQIPSDVGFKAGLILFFLSTEIGIIPISGLDANIKNLLKRLSEKRRRKKNTGLF